MRVGHESISVKLADGRLIDTRVGSAPQLTAEKIAARYKFGDQVEIDCDRIRPVWEEETARYQSLEVKKLRFLHEPPAEELSDLLEIPVVAEEVNLLARPNPRIVSSNPPAIAVEGSDDVAHRKLEHAREVNAQYTANMPNFVADETAKRYSRDPRSGKWRYVDTIQTEITFRGRRAERRNIRRNGRRWNQPYRALPGFTWYGGFGTEIEPIFSLMCPTVVEFERSTEIRGKPVLEYAFRSPADGCFGPFTFGYQRYNPSRAGQVFLDDPDGRVIQLDEQASGFPSDFAFAQRNEEVMWDLVKTGDGTHLLPVAANFLVTYSSGQQWRIEIEYKNHRHFEASTNVIFH